MLQDDVTLLCWRLPVVAVGLLCFMSKEAYCAFLIPIATVVPFLPV